MYQTFTPPSTARVADRPSQIDEGLVAEVRQALYATVQAMPFAASLTRQASQSLFAARMTTLSAGARARGVPVEKLIIAIKLAWAKLPGSRTQLGEGAPEVLAGAVSACIEAYFAAEERTRAD
jgi:hypothetical protein